MNPNIEPNPAIEVAPFYNPRSYIATDGDQYWVSTYAIRLNNIIVSVVNGTMCTNPVDDEPFSTNFDAYMADQLPTTPTTPELLIWDPATARYITPNS